VEVVERLEQFVVDRGRVDRSRLFVGTAAPFKPNFDKNDGKTTILTLESQSLGSLLFSSFHKTNDGRKSENVVTGTRSKANEGEIQTNAVDIQRRVMVV
jgi:hypothetical protein